MDRKKTVSILILIVIIFLIGGYLVLKGNSQNTTTDSEEKQQNTSDLGDVEKNNLVPTVTLDVKGSEFRFDPSSLKVKKGDIVKINFENTGRTSHNFILQGLNAETGTIEPGKKDSVVFVADKIGNFDFHCSVDSHETFGMKGTLTVE